MSITWTIIVLGALLHGIASEDNDASTSNPTSHPGSVVLTTTVISTAPTTSTQENPTTTTQNMPPNQDPLVPESNPSTTITTVEITTVTQGKTSVMANEPTQSVTTTQDNPTERTSQLAQHAPTTQPNSSGTTTPTDFSQQATQPSATASPSQGDTTTQPKASASSEPTSPELDSTSNGQTGLNPTTVRMTTQPSPTQTQTLAAVDPTTNLPTTQRPKPFTTNDQTNIGSPTKLITTMATHPETTISQSLSPNEKETTSAPITSVLSPDIRSTRHDDETGTSTSMPEKFTHEFDLSASSEGNIMHEACKTLAQKMTGTCSVHVTIHNKQLTVTLTINTEQEIQPERYKPLEKKEEISKDSVPDTLIAILASCGALVLILCSFAVYCSYHRRSYRKNQQHLTEELQTVENGYHDNPTLEVMEVQPEMQEKKLTLNGEFNDSWIVPIDNLLKEDMPDEEDTHL